MRNGSQTGNAADGADSREGNSAPLEFEEQSLWIAIRQEPENTQHLLSLIDCLLRQCKSVPLELEERSLWIAIAQEPENTRHPLSLVACLLRQCKSVPLELEERSLRIAIAQGPENTQHPLSLIACLLRQGKPVPLELEERALRIAIAQEPENTQHPLSLIACLLRQGKPVPLELEERALWIAIAQEPENTQHLTSLIACLLRQGKPVPLELEERALWIAVAQEPENAHHLTSLIACLLRQDKLVPPEREERSLRLLLRDHPDDFECASALIALLHRTGRPLFPYVPTTQPATGTQDLSGLEELLQLSDEYARAGETSHVYAAMWQACVRYPRTMRPWAEFARRLADRAAWSDCRMATEYVLRADAIDEITAKAVLSALSTLAEHGELAALNWQVWMGALPGPLQVDPDALKLLTCTNNAAKAAMLIPSAIKLWSRNAETWIVASMAACEAEQPQEAYDYIQRAFVLNPVLALRAVVGKFGQRFVEIVDQLKKYDEIADWLTERSHEYEVMNVIMPSAAPEAKLAVQERRRAAIGHGLPSAFLVTQPKSASVSVGRIFHSGFGLPTVLYSLVNLRVVLPWLQDYLRGGACYVTHLLPSPRNVDLLVAGGAQCIIVHVRDPRQWVISSTEHSRLYPNLVSRSSRERRVRGFADALDFTIETMAPMIAWIEGWVKAREKLTVHFTTFEEFVCDRDRFFDRMLSLYGGDTRFFDRKRAIEEQPGVDYHRRLGLIDEWKSILTRQQIERINSVIPDEFWNLFGWKP